MWLSPEYMVQMVGLLPFERIPFPSDWDQPVEMFTARGGQEGPEGWTGFGAEERERSFRGGEWLTAEDILG